MKKVSIIIPCREIDELTEKCIHECLKLDYDNFEHNYTGLDIDKTSNFKYCVGKQSKALVLNNTIHNYIRKSVRIDPQWMSKGRKVGKKFYMVFDYLFVVENSTVKTVEILDETSKVVYGIKDFKYEVIKD